MNDKKIYQDVKTYTEKDIKEWKKKFYTATPTVSPKYAAIWSSTERRWNGCSPNLKVQTCFMWSVPMMSFRMW